MTLNVIKIVEYVGDCGEKLYLLREEGTTRAYGPYYLQADAERMARYLSDVRGRPYARQTANSVVRIVAGGVVGALAAWLLSVSPHEYAVGLVVAVFVVAAKL